MCSVVASVSDLFLNQMEGTYVNDRLQLAHLCCGVYSRKVILTLNLHAFILKKKSY